MTISVIGSLEDNYQSGTPATSRTINVATGTRTNGFIAVAVAVMTDVGSDVSGVTWGGVALTKAVETSSTVPYVDWWYLLDPAGGTDNIVVSFSGTGVTASHICVVWGDSDDTLNFGDNSIVAETTGDPASVSLDTTETGELCLGAYVTQDNNVAASGDTLLQDHDAGGNCAGTSYLIAGTPATYALDWDRNPSGISAVFSMAAFSVYEPTTGSPPSVVLNTADSTTFNTSAPSLEFTATDPDGNDVRCQIQISDQPDFSVSGTFIEDQFNGGGSLSIHPQPLSFDTTRFGDPQVDDRPGNSFTAAGGILEGIDVNIGNDSSPNGTAYVRVYAHQGTFGASSEPLNAADPADTPTDGWLAISDGIVFDGDESATHQFYLFNFSGDNRIRLTAGTKYVWILDWIPTSTTITNTISIAGDSLNGGTLHGGNAYLDGFSAANNGVHADWDVHFRVRENHITLDKISGTAAGFINTVAGEDTDPFNSGQMLRYTVQVADALDNGVYYWRVRSSDPFGSGTFGDWTAPRSFTVNVVAGSVSLSAAVVAASSTPNDGTLAVLRSIATAVAAQSATPDAPILPIMRQMVTVATAPSATPDNGILSVIHQMTAVTVAGSVTPNNIDLLIAGLISLSAAVTAVSGTPDNATVASLRQMAAACTAGTASPDDVTIGMIHSLTAIVAAQSATPDNTTVAILRSLGAVVSGVAATPDDAALVIARPLAAVIASASNTPDDVDLLTAIIVNLISLAWSSRRPSVTASVRGQV